MKSKLRTLVLGLCVGSFYASSAMAAQFFWNAPTGGAFNDPNNWLSGMVPGTMDNPVFFQVAAYTVSFPAIAETGPLNVVDGNVTFSLGGNTYIVNGNVDIGGSLALPLGVGALSTPAVSLTVNDPNGTLEVGGTIIVSSGGALNGSSTVVSDTLIINSGGQLRGSLSLLPTGPGGGVVNSGAVAPGNGAGILTIGGDYSQSASGLLEIEVGGLTAGGQHDQLFLPTSSAIVAGRLDVPFINSYTPAVGHDIIFLLSGTSSGSFDIISLPDYQSSPVAVQVNYLPTGASLSFVTPTAASAAVPDPNTPIVLWGNASTWTGNVPITSDVVDLANSDPAPSRINLDVGTPGSQRAFAHEVNISSLSPAAPSTLGIPSGTSLSAISRVTVSESGIVDLSGGAVYTNLVQVDVGGKVLGNGTIAGDVVLGNGLASGEATLNPSGASSAGGVINVENLTINSEGVLAVLIDDPNNFGQVVVEGTASLGGRLVIDATNLTAPIGTTFNIVVADTFDLQFDSIETVGGDGTVFFAPVVLPPLISPGIEPLVANCQNNGGYQVYGQGDMNLDGFADGDDAADFVLALLNPSGYMNDHCQVDPEHAGDFTGNESVDFDDIDLFVAKVGGGLIAADIFALIEQMSVPEPTTGGLLLLASGLLGATGSRRLKCSVRQSG